MSTTTELPGTRTGSVVDVHPEHLIVTQTWDTGDYTNVHVMNDADLTIKLAEGGDKIGKHAQDGLVLLALGVDRDHDEVSIKLGTNSPSMLDMVRRAQAVLRVAEQGLVHVTSGAGA